MAMTRGTLPETLEPWVTEIFFNEYTRQDMMYPSVTKVTTSSKAFEDTFKVAGFGTFILKPEGTPISYDNAVQGPRRRVTHSTFALGYRVTEEMQDDEQHGIIGQMAADLADAGRNHQEQIFAQPWNTAGVATSFTTQDGLALISAAHVALKTGTAISNAAVPAVALSHTGLESMMTQIRTMDDDTDRPLVLNPNLLIVHPDDEWEGQRLLESEFEINTSENQINVMKGSRTGLSLFPYRFLTDTNNWFIQSSEHKVTVYMRKELTQDSPHTDAQTKDMLVDARWRGSIIPWDHFGINGSLPA